MDTDGRNILWLLDWYARRCDGAGAHSYGIQLSTLDNPGWSVVVRLSPSELCNVGTEQVAIDAGDDDWLFCRVDLEGFSGQGDPSKLDAIIAQFRRLVEGCSKDPSQGANSAEAEQ